MLTKEQYLFIRNNPSVDGLPVIHSCFLVKSNIFISEEHFNVLFSKWLMSTGGIHFMSKILSISFSTLDKHFNI